tara:strand:- start:65 stop:292 length:228 start_codon:yes stop_codon:yes gene_type:complete
MADFDAEKVTKIMEERATGYASRDTAAKELMELTGLDYDVAKAFCSNLKRRGSAGIAEVRGYKKGEFPAKKKKTP